jgi:hypothetical protein
MSFETQDMCRTLCIPIATKVYDDAETPAKAAANILPQKKITAVSRIHNYT